MISMKEMPVFKLILALINEYLLNVLSSFIIRLKIRRRAESL